MANTYQSIYTGAEIDGGITKARSAETSLTDLCLGYDGTTYKTAGEAVRSQIKQAIESGGSTATIGYVTLLSNKWVGDTSPYSQVVEIAGVTVNSQVDLTPSVNQLAVFYDKDLAFVTENEDGVVTVYAIGQKPQNDYTIQVTITEVNV